MAKEDLMRSYYKVNKNKIQGRMNAVKKQSTDKYTLELTKEELTTLNALIMGRIVSLNNPKGYMRPELVEDIKQKLTILRDKIVTVCK